MLTKERIAYNNMLGRCYCKSYSAYPYYGGRGIGVCDEWRNSYNTFLQDMGEAPSPDHSLSRKDHDDWYTPENCIWEPLLDNQRNQRNTIMLTCKGLTLPLKEWARWLDVNSRTLKTRRAKGWSDEQILTIPIKGKKLL